ncbi:MAG TPA: CpsB/CapC family capsule biosynthesis tyrosine phosphatase [Acidobacteriaceae bacterium]|nr:CpsB/CapC family capsule biosynthesis tyrosine phosphatase [Acidobacteriaceae bacterium]
MIDIHHHLLFGLDDGSKDIDTSVAMAEMAAADGITHIVCTPHANAYYHFDPAVNQEKIEQIRARLDGKITLGLGCDFHLSFENIQDALKNPSKYTINGKRYLLVEFPDLAIPPTMTGVFYEFQLAGIQPIITHPERNPTIQKNPHRLDEWIEHGCLVQVTASSLTGRFGPMAQTLSYTLLKQNKVHFIASDAHNLDSRPPRMKEAYNVIAKQYGPETAERLCGANPKAAFFGEDLPPQPGPVPKEDSSSLAIKGSFWSRLFKKT